MTADNGEILIIRGDDETTPLISHHVTRRRARFRPFRLCCWCILGTILAVFSLIALLLFISFVDFRKPLPEIGKSLDDPGVGLDIMPSYATLAYRFKNESNIGIAKVPHEAEEIGMMKWMAGHNYQRPAWGEPCFSGFEYERNFGRSILAHLGLPSTKDVANFSKIISRIKDIAERKTGVALRSMVVTLPMYRGVCLDDIAEAARLHGIAVISEEYVPGQIYEAVAASAFFGIGLCQNYKNKTICHEQEKQFPELGLFSVAYSELSLVLDGVWLKVANARIETEAEVSYNYTLGSGSAPPEGSPEAKIYWQNIKEGIKRWAVRFLNLWPIERIDRLVLIGESADRPDFKSVVQKAIAEAQLVPPVIHDADPLYAAAKGAAEIAKRQNDRIFVKNNPHEHKALKDDAF